MKKQALRLALCLVALISPWAAIAQTITLAAITVAVPAQKINQSITINGKAVKFTITVPAQNVIVPEQTVTLPVAVPALPAGLNFINGAFVVNGSITGNSITLLGGDPVPVSASGLYVLQLNTTGFMQPVPYIPYVPTTTN